MKSRKPVILVALVLVTSVAASDSQGPYIVTVDDVRELEPGVKWNPSTDDVIVQIRGYLRGNGNMHLYPTKDQALLDDFLAGVAVSDEGEGDLRKNCSEGFVELVAKLAWMETEQRAGLIPSEAKRLILREHKRAEEQVCWKAESTISH